VSFLDARCRGIEIVAVADAGGTRTESRVGVYAPRVHDPSFETIVPDPGREAVALDIRPSPAHREEVDYCTVVLRDLRVDPAP
jgi:hypothetical protein